jgi:hypothetical protein
MVMARISSGARPEGRMGILSLELAAPYLLGTAVTMQGMEPMRHVLPLLGLLLAGCATTTPEVTEPASAQAPQETITFALNSWGKPIAYWQVREVGSGELWRIVDKGDFRTYDIEKYRFTLPEEAGLPFIAATEIAHDAAVKGLPCERTITDMPYGAITWTYPAAEKKLAVDFGCTGEGTGKVYNALGRATEVIEKQGRIEAKPYAVEHVGEPR